jgi:glycosyltransferase involved in cell wall biosynthesis
MTDWHPRVTAMLPAYNSEAFIQRTLDSLAAQTWDNLEILIADDCSTDGTPRILAEFAAAHPNVRLLLREHNLGWLKNSNSLMANAEGELLFFAFHDDVIEPDYVRVLVQALRNRPNAILSYTDMDVFEADGRRRVLRFRGLDGKRSTLARGMAMLDRPRNWWVPHRGLFRATAFARSGGIKPNSAGEFSADWTWLVHLALLGDFVRVPKLCYHKYFMSTSLSKSWKRTPRGYRALAGAGQHEVWSSALPLRHRLVLVAYASLHLKGLRERLPRGLRGKLSRWLGG